MTPALHWLALVAAIAAAAANRTSDRSGYIVLQKPRCTFRYDEKLETRVLSILQHELSSRAARFYDPRHPIVTVCRSKATLMFSGTLEFGGMRLLDPKHIFVDVDVCSHHVLAVDHDDGMTIADIPPCG